MTEDRRCKRSGTSIDDGEYCAVCYKVREQLGVTGKKACGKCSTIIDADSGYCPYCGSAIFGEAAPENSPDDQETPTEHHLRVIKGLLIAGAVYLILKELLSLINWLILTK